MIADSLAAHGAAELAAPTARPAAPRGRRVRLPSRHARPAPEQRRARGGRRRAAARRRRRARLRGARRAGAHRAAGAPSSPIRACCTRRIATLSERAAGELAILRKAAGDPRALRADGAAPVRHLEVPVGVRPARGRRAAEGGRPAARRPSARSRSCRCSRRSPTSRSAATIMDAAFARAGLPRDGRRAATTRRK